MNSRTRASLAIALSLLGAVTLASCSTPGPAFHLIGATSVASKVNVGEQQLVPGIYSFAADAPGDVSGLHWQLTYGPSSNPTATPVASMDGVATVTTTFSAPTDKTKRVYRVCLSTAAQPTVPSCQDYAVGAPGLLIGLWTSSPGDPGATILVTEAGAATTASITVVRGTSVVATGTKVSPFLFQFTDAGRDIYLEWTSPTELKLGNFYAAGTANPVTFTFVGIPPA